VVSTLVVAATLVLMRWNGIPGWDDAAHAYKILLLRDGHSIFWDTYWYGGSYGAVTYGFLFYWLAQYVPGALIVVLAAGTVPLSYYVYQRDLWGISDVWPAWAFAFVMMLYQAHGQDPFVLALALTMGGLALLARRRPVWAALPVALGIFANPMGLVVAVPLMLTDFIARPETRRRYLWFGVALAPAALVRLALGFAFSEPGAYLNETSQLLVYLSFALFGVALAGVNAVHPRRPFVILFLTYSVVCLLSFVTPGSPLGNNIGRFFMVFGLPLLLLLRHTRLRRPFRYGELAIIPIVLFAVLQFGTSISHFTERTERPQTTRAYFAPALRVAREVHDPNYRIHVVALRRHWEALYFPEAGYPITRGWYRQADAIHNGLFYASYDAAAYADWLRTMGVQYVFRPEGPYDPWSRREVRFLETSTEFEFVEQAGVWRVYRLREARPLLVTMPGAPGVSDGTISEVDHQRIAFSVDAPGAYLLKFTWSPYWVLEGGPGTLRRGPGGWLALDLRRAGPHVVRFDVTPAKVLDAVVYLPQSTRVSAAGPLSRSRSTKLWERRPTVDRESIRAASRHWTLASSTRPSEK
jgi:hypothetical protein